ncbi:hypothetical protein F4803DRAFT_506479 [Xylaria telfairii]|nr:hypothetical protein F4803DRAFT_506479 [Xylaria telfairii]
MEVIGTVAAIPGLVDLAKTTIGLVHDVCRNRKVLSQATAGLEAQLQALTDVLELIVIRHSTLLSSGQRTKLTPLIQQIVEQLEALNRYLSSARSESRLHRIKVAVKRPQLTIKDDVQNLAASIDVLKLYLLECSLTLNEESVAAARSAKKSELRGFLSPDEHDFIRAKLDGTLDWMLLHPTAALWLTKPASTSPETSLPSRLLIIHGPKGFGKSVLAAWISDHIRITGMQCAFFAFFYGSDKQKKCKSMFATLLWQILNFDGISHETLDQIHDIVLSSNDLSIPTLIRAMEHAMSAITSIFYLVIDGVDESDEDWEEAEGPFHTLESWLNRFPNLRILLSGRRSVLRGILGSYPNSSIELLEEATKGDIHKFIAYKIQESVVLKEMPESLKDHIRQTLEQKSTGMFLWVELVFKELRYCYSPTAIRDCLQDLPRDLEAEYARLFSRLMYRHSDSKRPTPQINAAHTLLALIMGALESLTVDDLRYAYAASCGRGSMWREDLITADAVLDLIGDFVSCTDHQKVRFCHSSLEDLLFLPQEHWTGSLEVIKFFRLEYSKCHELMAKACFEYMTNFDFGHPLTDNSYHQLINQPFLLYATKNGLSHKFSDDSKKNGVSSSQLESIKAYVAGTHFGGLLEFVAIASIENDGFIEGYINSVVSDPELDISEILTVIEQRITAESQTRLSLFGPDHPVTQAWAQIQNAVTTSLNINGRQTSSYALKSQFKDQSVIKDSRSTILNLLQSIGEDNEDDEVPLRLVSQPNSSRSHGVRGWGNANLNTIGAINSAMNSHAQQIIASHPLGMVLQLWVDPRTAFAEVAQKFVAGLPIPIHIAYAATMVHDEGLKTALLDSARRRTEGQKTLYRAWALLESSIIMNAYYDKDVRATYCREAHDILMRLEENPLTRRMVYINISLLIPALTLVWDATEVPKFIDDLCNRIAHPRVEVGRHRQRRHFYSFIYRTSKWTEFEISLLGQIASQLLYRDHFKDAERVYSKVVTCAKAHYGPDGLKTRHLLVHYIECLIQNSKLAEAEGYLAEWLSLGLPKESMRSSPHIFYLGALMACKLGRFDQGSRVLDQLLNVMDPSEGETWIDTTWEEMRLVIQARVLLLEALGKDPSLDPSHNGRERLLRRCLKQLDETPPSEIRELWLDDAVWKCCVVSDQVFGADHNMTWRLEDYLPYSVCGEKYDGCGICRDSAIFGIVHEVEITVHDESRNQTSEETNQEPVWIKKKVFYLIWLRRRSQRARTTRRYVNDHIAIQLLDWSRPMSYVRSGCYELPRSPRHTVEAFDTEIMLQFVRAIGLSRNATD